MSLKVRQKTSFAKILEMRTVGLRSSSGHVGLPHTKVPTARLAIGRRERNHVITLPRAPRRPVVLVVRRCRAVEFSQSVRRGAPMKTVGLKMQWSSALKQQDLLREAVAKYIDHFFPNTP